MQRMRRPTASTQAQRRPDRFKFNRMCRRVGLGASGAPAGSVNPCVGFAPAAPGVAHPPGLGCCPPPAAESPGTGPALPPHAEFSTILAVDGAVRRMDGLSVLAFFLHHARPRPVPWTHYGLIPRSVSPLRIICVAMRPACGIGPAIRGERGEEGGNGRWQVTAIR